MPLVPSQEEFDELSRQVDALEGTPPTDPPDSHRYAINAGAPVAGDNWDADPGGQVVDKTGQNFTAEIRYQAVTSHERYGNLIVYQFETTGKGIVTVLLAEAWEPNYAKGGREMSVEVAAITSIVNPFVEAGPATIMALQFSYDGDFMVTLVPTAGSPDQNAAVYGIEVLGDQPIVWANTPPPIEPPIKPDPPTDPPSDDVDLVLPPDESVNLRGATDLRIGWEPGTVVGRMDLDDAKRVIFVERGMGPLQVDGTRDAGGSLQSGTVSAWRTEGVELAWIDVLNSPRSSFSVEHSVSLQLVRCSSINAWHLGVHGGHTDHLRVASSLFENSSRRIPSYTGGEQSEGWESGDIKITKAVSPLLEDNTCRGGYGPGLWFDIYVTDGVMRFNRVFDKNFEGLYDELSIRSSITDNLVRNSPTGNNAARMNWLYGAGLLISTSFGGEYLRNDIEGSYHGIIAIDQSWRDDTPEGYDASDYFVDHNKVNDVFKLGAGQDVDKMDIFNPDAWGDNNDFTNVRQYEWQGPNSPF